MKCDNCINSLKLTTGVPSCWLPRCVKDRDERLLYECDPKKNVECRKHRCSVNMCHLTFNKAYAKDGAVGQAAIERFKKQNESIR